MYGELYFLEYLCALFGGSLDTSQHMQKQQNKQAHIIQATPLVRD